MQRKGCECECQNGRELCVECLEDAAETRALEEMERAAETRALEEMERGITLAELDFEEDSDFSLMTRPQRG